MLRFFLPFVFLFTSLFAQPIAVQRADALLEEGAWDDAIRLLEDTLRAYPKPDTNRAWILHRLGGIQYYNFKYQKADSLLNEAADLRKHLLPNNNPQRAQTAYMQGVVRYVQNLFADAELALLEANTIWEHQAHPPLSDLADGYKLLGELYSKIGDFGRGEWYIKKAFEATDKVYGKGPEFAEVLLLHSRLLDRKGKSRRALATLKQAASIFTKQGDPYYTYSLADSWQNTGLAYNHLEKPDSALFFLRKAAAAYQQIATEWNDPDAQKAVFDNWDNQGIMLRKLGQLDEANAMHTTALDSLLVWYEGEHSDLAPTYDNLGDLATERGKIKDAIQSYQKGLSCLQLPDKQWADPSLANKLLLGLATAYNTQYMRSPKPELAEHILDVVQTADTLLRHTSETYLEDSSRHFLTRQYLQLYEIGICAARDLNRDEDAFYLMAAGRSSLLRHAVNSTQAAKALGIPDSLIRAQRMLQAQIATTTDHESRETILASMNTLSDYLRVHYPAFADFRKTSIPSLKATTQYIRSDEVVVMCFWGEQKVYMVLLEKDNKQWLQFDVEHIGEIVESLIRHQQDVRSSKKEYHRLSDNFLKDSLALGPSLSRAKHLLILPDGPLATLSWAGLPYEDGLFLTEKMAIRTAPAIDLAFRTNGKAQPGSLVYATAPWYGRFTQWPDLPMARSTAVHAYSLFGGRLDTGNSARLDHFVDMAPLANILHIGAHGILNDKRPLAGGIQLADSMLTVAQVYGMKLPARLAVLTSCHSGGGTHQRGEGVLSMARAFAHAGCRSLVMSLWEASADATAIISEHFYEHLKQGAPQEIALQKAQQAYLKQAQPERKHPYYWAGISLTGEAGTEYTSSVWIIMLGALFIAGLLLWAWLGRGGRRNNSSLGT